MKKIFFALLICAFCSCRSTERTPMPMAAIPTFEIISTKQLNYNVRVETSEGVFYWDPNARTLRRQTKAYQIEEVTDNRVKKYFVKQLQSFKQNKAANGPTF